VHRTEGEFVLAWNEFRHYGPVLRFDPHPEPAREHADCAVWYGAGTIDAALAEAFQVDRTIDRVRDRPYLTGLAFTRTLNLLDVAVDSSGAWATRAGGTFAISTAPHAITQRWAHAIVQAAPDVDGVRYNIRRSQTGAPRRGHEHRHLAGLCMCLTVACTLGLVVATIKVASVIHWIT